LKQRMPWRIARRLPPPVDVPEFHRRAIDVLMVIGTNALAATPAIVQGLNDPVDRVAGYAAMLLGNLKVKEAVPALIQALARTNSFIRFRILDALSPL